MNRLQLIGLACIVIGFSLSLLMFCSRPNFKNACSLAFGIILILAGASGIFLSLEWRLPAHITGGLAALVVLLVLVFSIAGIFDSRKTSR